MPRLNRPRFELISAGDRSLCDRGRRTADLERFPRVRFFARVGDLAVRCSITKGGDSFVGIDGECLHCSATCASSCRSFRTHAPTRLAGANLRSIRRRFVSPPTAYRSFGRAAVAAFSTTSATTPGSSAALTTSLSLLPRAARTARYSSSFASGSSKLASNRA
jgi:hypothetical protein